ncbi:MAG: hypothetical protein J6T29_00730 [Alphaproteobacteria bacterium]|nr:hypothetical protein [Alphaproteobacteria bacterium]
MEWKTKRKLLSLILIGQIIPELTAQDLNTIDKASKTDVISQQNPENPGFVNKTQIQETKIEEKIVEQLQAVTPVTLGTITKHGMEFSINKIISKEALDVQKIVSPDELDAVKEQSQEYFNKKYLNKEVVVIGAFDSISRRDKNYKLKIDRFNSGFFSTSLSCSFSDIRDLIPLMQLLDIDNYYVLVKGIVTSSSSLKNCIIVGVAKFKI